MDTEGYIALFYIVAKHGTSNHIEVILRGAQKDLGDLADQLFQVVAIEVISWFSTQGKISEIYRFSEILRILGFDSVAHIGYQEVSHKSSNRELQELARDSFEVIRATQPRFGLPDWYTSDPTCNQGL